MDVSYPLMTQIEVRQIADGVLLSVALREHRRDGFYHDSSVVGPFYFKTEDDALDSAPRIAREARAVLVEERLKREQQRGAVERVPVGGAAGGRS